MPDIANFVPCLVLGMAVLAVLNLLLELFGLSILGGERKPGFLVRLLMVIVVSIGIGWLLCAYKSDLLELHSEQSVSLEQAEPESEEAATAVEPIPDTDSEEFETLDEGPFSWEQCTKDECKGEWKCRDNSDGEYTEHENCGVLPETETEVLSQEPIREPTESVESDAFATEEIEEDLDVYSWELCLDKDCEEDWVCKNETTGWYANDSDCGEMPDPVD